MSTSGAFTASLTADLHAGRALKASGFVAADFETATSARASACALAIAIVQAGEVASVHHWLVRPPGNEYDDRNISIHGITPKMTADSPTLIEIWPEVLAQIDGRVLVAHNAAFDMSVLRGALQAHGSAWPKLSYYCTLALSRRAWPGMSSYRLPDIATACGLTLAHHDPRSDACAAAEIAVACCGSRGEQRLPDAARALSIGPASL